MKKVLILIMFLAAGQIFAQEKDSTNLNKWIPKGIAGLNISQIAFDNWTQGGENSITYGLLGNFGLNYFSEKWKFKNSLKLAYGQTKTGDAGFKTNDNELYQETVLSRQLGWVVDPYFSNTIRTTIVAGFKYTDSSRNKIMDFFDPGYISQSIGFAYDQLENIQTRLGVGFQETFADEFINFSDDPETKDEIESFRFETGIESVTDVNQSLGENLLYSSKLRLFTRFTSLDVWDVRWDNTITAQINKYVNVNLNVLIVYQKNQSLKTQIKEALQLGLTFNLF